MVHCRLRPWHTFRDGLVYGLLCILAPRRRLEHNATNTMQQGR